MRKVSLIVVAPGKEFSHDEVVADFDVEEPLMFHEGDFIECPWDVPTWKSAVLRVTKVIHQVHPHDEQTGASLTGPVGDHRIVLLTDVP